MTDCYIHDGAATSPVLAKQLLSDTSSHDVAALMPREYEVGLAPRVAAPMFAGHAPQVLAATLQAIGS